jgi:transcriptional regulator with XRE-family HTH domain
MVKGRKQVQPQFGIGRAFGAAMRKARLGKHMSQMGLHMATGLDRTFISDLERGIQVPSLDTVFRVAEGLGVSAWSLVRDAQASPYFRAPKSPPSSPKRNNSAKRN